MAFLRTSATVSALLLIVVAILDAFDVPVVGGGRYWTANGPPVEVELGWLSVLISLGLGTMTGLMHVLHMPNSGD